MTQHTPRIRASATTLGASERYCTCCGKALKLRFAWLELDQRTQTYHDFGNVPPERSQGWFPFGLTCARGELARAAQIAQGSPDTIEPSNAEGMVP